MSTNYIDQIKDNQATPVTHDIQEATDIRIFRATCSTAAGTAAKVATLQDNKNFTLAAGVKVAVTFQYGNTQGTPTLRVDGSTTGTAKNIGMWSDNTTIQTGGGSTYFYWGPYETIIFTYDGTRWIISQGGSIYKAYALANSKTANTGTVTSIATTSPISGGTITTSGTISHATSGVGTAVTTAGFYKFKYDTYGHVTGVTAVTASDITGLVTIPTNTDEKVKLTSTTTTNSYPIPFSDGTPTSGNTYSELYNTDFSYQAGNRVLTVGTATLSGYYGTSANAGAVNVLTLGNNVAQSTASAHAEGQIYLYSRTTYKATIGCSVSPAYTADVEFILPNKSGTFALTSDIPTVPSNIVNTITTTAGTHTTITNSTGSVSFKVPTKTSHLTNDSGFITTDSDEKVAVAALTSGTTYYPILATGTGTATRQIDSTLTGLTYISTAGTTSTTGTAILILGNNKGSTTSNNEAGVLRLYGSGTTYTELRAASSSNSWRFYIPAASGTQLNDNYNLVGAYSVGAAMGGSTQPVYIAQGGLAQTCSTYAGGTAVTLNGTSKAASTASFYAPTAVGTSGQILKSNGSGAPSWADLSASSVQIVRW